MLGEKMKKVINTLGCISVFVSILAIIFTWLTTYSFTYKFQTYFRSLTILQWCMVCTMIFLGLNFVNFKKNARNYVYATLCVLFAVGTIFFMYMRVY